MLYDLAAAPPMPGSLLESVFTIIALRRQEARFLETRMLVDTLIGVANGDSSKIDSSYNDYINCLFPFVKGYKEEREEQEKKVMKNWVELGSLKVKPLSDSSTSRKVISKLQQISNKNSGR